MMENFKFSHLKFIIYLSFVIWILTFIVVIQPIYALESSPSADIKSKLQELQKEIASKAAKLKLEVNKKLQNKAYIGVVKQKSSISLTIASKNGPKIVNLNQDTIYEVAPKVKGKHSFKNIEQEDNIAALGDIDDIGVLNAKKIILLNPMPQSLFPKTYLWGQVISISDRLITVKNNQLKNIAVSITDATNLKVNDFVIIVGSKNSNDIYLARFLYTIKH